MFSGKRYLLLTNNWKKYLHEIYCRRELSQNVSPTLGEIWKPVIGLEIHAQISTKSKLFSGASTEFATPVNSCVSLFDCATPGTMPVLNKKCVEASVATALALSCKVNEISFFERKHYFYADLPAGFQITQQKQPLAVDGELLFHVEEPHLKDFVPYSKIARIKQIQLEQDSGRSWKDECTQQRLIDLNRSGMPLMEIVFQPDLSTGEEACALIKELILILNTLETCSCKQEEGALRIDANVSVNKEDEPLNARTEIKNIGSIRAVAAAINYEIKRQTDILSTGNAIFSETRHWDQVAKRTVPMREKEERLDYRFMPETNLPPLRIHIDENIENEHDLVDLVDIKKLLPELPEQIRCALRNTYGLAPVTVSKLMNNESLRKLFLIIANENRKRKPAQVAHFVHTDIVTFLYKEKLDIAVCMKHTQFLGEVFDLMRSDLISDHYGMKLFQELIDNTGKSAKLICEENDWFIITDRAELEKVCSVVIKENPKLVKQHQKKRTRTVFALVTQVMKVTNHRVNKYVVIQIIENLLQQCDV